MLAVESDLGGLEPAIERLEFAKDGFELVEALKKKKIVYQRTYLTSRNLSVAVTGDGGSSPFWSPEGDEIYFELSGSPGPDASDLRLDGVADEAVSFAEPGAELSASAVMLGLALALKATAAGLIVAIPATLIYNAMVRRVDVLTARWNSLQVVS